MLEKVGRTQAVAVHCAVGQRSTGDLRCLLPSGCWPCRRLLYGAGSNINCAALLPMPCRRGLGRTADAHRHVERVPDPSVSQL